MLINCRAELKRLVYVNNVAREKETIATYDWYITAVNEESKLIEWWKFCIIESPNLAYEL